jgi:hypothetical protein
LIRRPGYSLSSNPSVGGLRPEPSHSSPDSFTGRLRFVATSCCCLDPQHLSRSEALDTFWRAAGPRLEHILRNALLALVEQPQATLAGILRLLDDCAFRKLAAGRVSSSQVRDFWLREYESYPARFRAEAIAPIQNTVGAFLADPLLNRILAQPRSAFDVRELMEEGKVLLVNLAKGKVGGDTTALLGALLVARVGLAAVSRADVPEAERRDFYLYLDEFQSFTTLSLANMLSGLRKYRVGMVLAHQYLSQLDPQVRDAILGNVGTHREMRPINDHNPPC